MGLESVELVMAWEERFGIEIENPDAEKLVTPRDAAALIKRTLDGLGRPMPLPEIEEIVKETTIVQLGLKEEKFGFDLRFVQDMGYD
ncbi:MAG: hypothetical protein AAGJ79_12010 [Verrucomicrobiota bacterium]